jgi:1-deoxyxylulose-5-phosphate synthase
MQYGNVPGVDKPVSRIVMGSSWNEIGDVDEKLRLINDVFELGCNTIDTAQDYCDGESERVIGRWLAESGARDEVVIISKGAHPLPDRNRVTPEDITSDLGESLDRLGTAAIDLYLLHRDDESVPVGPLVECLAEHRAAGRIGAYGGSNWTVERIREANAYAEAHGLAPFVASSPHFSMAVPREMPWPGCVAISGPDAEADRRWYAETQMPAFCWSSLACGFLTGRFRRDNLDSFEGYFDELVLRCYCTEENFRRLDWAERVATERGLTVAQVSLAWLFGQGLNVFSVVAAGSPQEMADNIAALDAAGTLPEVGEVSEQIG